ncbi:MAG: polysaccharide deacetylase family protein [Anaerolineae bacterium]|nr:polysaccharide deacetylase family protein [Anaerolineae bacterium]
MSKRHLTLSTIAAVVIVMTPVLTIVTTAQGDITTPTPTPVAAPPGKPTLRPLLMPTLPPTAAGPVTLAPPATPTPTVVYPTPTPDTRPSPTPDGRTRNVRAPILMYHYVGDLPANADNYRVGLTVTPGEFRAQMQYMASNGYETVTLDDVIYALAQGHPLPEKPVVLSFDDGYADMYTHVFPILRECGFVGTFFVVTEWIDQARPGYLTWQQVQEMAAAGMRIETHSKTHADLTDKPYDFLVYEIIGSIESIEAYTGRRPRFLCYPAGAYDDYLLSLLPGFQLWGAVTTEAGTRHYSDRPYTLRRVRIANDTTLSQFAGFLDWGTEGD